MKVFAIANQKGGVGKTTTTVNLAAAFSRLGHKTLLVDLDSQAHSTQWLLGKEADIGKGIYGVLIDGLEPLSEIIASEFGIDVLPSNVEMARFERNIAEELHREHKLERALINISKVKTYNFVFLDCPPSLDIGAINALFASDRVIIPIDCGIESYQAINRLLTTIKKVSQEQDKNFELFALPTFIERNRLAEEVIKSLRDNFPGRLLSGVRKTVRLAEAFAAKQPIFQYDVNAIGAIDYDKMAKEILDAA
ncbi:MAG: ParA family protein [Acidobacteriota bacterium]